MGRKIKFRAKRFDNGKWVYGYYYAVGGYHYIHSVRKMFGDSWVSNTYAVDPKTVGQFTSLPDVNGKEIYEDDICAFEFRSQKRVEAVIFMDGSFALGWAITLRRSQTDEYKEVKGSVEVIGNIHDNPDLLQQK